MATSRNNFIYVEQVPVFYWPFMATDLEQPNYYVDAIRFRSDKIFGNQLMVDLDAYQILGMRNRPRGTKWTFSTDYLSKRGFAGGTTFNYERQTLFGVPESTSGFVDIWGSERSRSSITWVSIAATFRPKKTSAVASSRSTGKCCPTISSSPAKSG